MDSIVGSDIGYVEEDSASCSATLDSARLSTAVQQILAVRRQGEWESEAPFQQPGGTTWLAGLAPPFQPPPHEVTDYLRDFSAAAATILEGQQLKGPTNLDVHTFLDLQGYNLDGIVEKRRREPGSTQLLFMFYSRIFEKLVGKQRGVDVPLFAPIDLSERLLGFRGILAFADDFKLCPSRVGRRELERIFATVHPGLDDADVESPRLKFESKITYAEFLDLLAYCGDAGEPMDRSKVDGSRARAQEGRLDRMKRLATFMSLQSVKKVKLALHNAYRDVHFWKLSDGADFEKEARAAEMRSRPQWRVEPVPLSRRLDRDGADAVVCRYLNSFTWLPTDQTWEEFDVPVLDMGTSFLGGQVKHFKLTLTNRNLMLGRVKVEVLRSCCPLRLPWRDTVLGPGQSADVCIDFVPIECGEWFGAIAVTAEWKGGQEVVTIPTYARVLQPQTAGPEVASRLPWHAPRPFRPGSSRRISLDPSSTGCRQMRPPVPHRSRSSTRSSTRPTSAVSGASAFPPRLPSRPGSGYRSSTPGARSGSAGGDSATAATPSGPSGDWRMSGAGIGGSDRLKKMRPHSAPSMSPQKSLPAGIGTDMSQFSNYPAAAGGGMAAVRARPRSASLRRSRIGTE